MRVTNIEQAFFWVPAPFKQYQNVWMLHWMMLKIKHVSNFTWNLRAALIIGIFDLVLVLLLDLNLAELRQAAVEVPKTRKS